MLLLFRATATPSAAIKYSEISAQVVRAAADAVDQAANAALVVHANVSIAARSATEAAALASGAPNSGSAAIVAAAASVAGARAASNTFHTDARKNYVNVFAADAATLERGSTSRSLGSKPLWPGRTAVWAQSAWAKTKHDLLALNENWDVWTRWYDALLEGSEAESEALAIARVSLPEALWAQGPKAVNAEIKRLELEEKYRRAVSHRQMELQVAQFRLSELQKSPDLSSPPPVPPPRTAALEPVVKNNSLKLPSATAKADLKGASPAAALKALKLQMSSLSAALRDETNIDKRIFAYLDRLRLAIPDKRPRQDIVFQLGHEIRVLQGYAAQVNAEWPELLAQSYHAMALAYERTIRQFPKWREFYANAGKNVLTVAQVEHVPEAARAVNEALRADDVASHVDAELTDAVQSLADQLAALTVAKEELAADIVESLSNTFKAVAEHALAGARWYIKGAAGGFVGAAKKQSTKDGEAAFKWTRKIVLATIGGGVTMSGTYLATWLGVTYPEQFSWILPVVAFLGSLVLPSKKVPS